MLTEFFLPQDPVSSWTLSLCMVLVFRLCFSCVCVSVLGQGKLSYSVRDCFLCRMNMDNVSPLFSVSVILR